MANLRVVHQFLKVSSPLQPLIFILIYFPFLLHYTFPSFVLFFSTLPISFASPEAPTYYHISLPPLIFEASLSPSPFFLHSPSMTFQSAIQTYHATWDASQCFAAIAPNRGARQTARQHAGHILSVCV